MSLGAHEPRFARAAAMLADPARSQMLAYLLGGEYASAGELAKAAGVSAATASGHLAKLLDAQMIVCEPRGRHRYYQLAGQEIAHALEALALVAERHAHDLVWKSEGRMRLRYARCCYKHLAGQVGVALFDALQRAACLESADEGLVLNATGLAWCRSIGFEPPAKSQRRYAYPCLDWSERRDHLAGQLADELLAHLLRRDWLRKSKNRAIEVTALGVKELLPLLS